MMISKCEMECFSTHNVKLESFEFLSNKIGGKMTIRDSRINVLSFHTCTIEGPTEFKKIEDWGTNNYSCSIYLNGITFLENVRIAAINFTNEHSKFWVENCTFEKNLYYTKNAISDFIQFDYSIFNNGKAYLDDINAEKIYLSRLNLEYIRFSSCVFPERYPELENESIARAEEVYRDLKTTAFEQKDFALVSKWHYLEKEMFLHGLKEQKKHLLYGMLYVYRELSGYGERPAKALKVLGGYILLVILALFLIGSTDTAADIVATVQRVFYSLKDFIPFFVTPTDETLLKSGSLADHWQVTYNFVAAFGRLFCVIQIALPTLAIRNQLKR